jgi:hypothetical protein
MSHTHRTDEDRALRAQLELHLHRQPITGRLRSDQGAEEPFVGWLGFVEALKRLNDATTAREEESPAAGPRASPRDAGDG